MNNHMEEMFEQGMRKLIAHHPSLVLDMDWETGVAVIGCLQLSLRHPENNGASAGLVRSMIDQIIEKVERVDTRLAQLLRLGDDPRHDVR